MALASFSGLSGTSFESYGDLNILLGLDFNSFIQVLEMVFTIEKAVYGFGYIFCISICMYTKFSILFDTQICTPNNTSKPFLEMGVFFSRFCLRFK